MERIIALFTIAAAVVLAQSPNLSITSGNTPVSQRVCNDASAGSIYTYLQPPASGFSGAYVCQQIGSTSLGSGAYGWVALANQGTSPGSGTVTVATGKTAAISNSLTFAGTDGTTFTTPTTSATAARTDAAQTFTGIQTFSSAPVIATIANTGTLTLPVATGGLPIVIACGATTGSTTCANTATSSTAKMYFGTATLASNTATITIGVGFTSSSTYQCIGQDQTTRANPVQVIPTSTTTLVITNTTGASDAIAWACFGY